MPVFHITLECTTPTAHADGAFRTLVAVTDVELGDGAHLREAARRAAIVGFGGPHRVISSRRFDAVTSDAPAHLATPDTQPQPPSMSERLELLLPVVTSTGDDTLEADAHTRRTAARRAQRVGIRG